VCHECLCIIKQGRFTLRILPLSILVLLALPVTPSEPSRSEKNLVARLKEAKERYEREQLAARKAFLKQSSMEETFLSARNKARLYAIRIQVELDVAQAELRKWIVGRWRIKDSYGYSYNEEGEEVETTEENGKVWDVWSDGTAETSDGQKMTWRIAGEAVVFEDAMWSRNRHWYTFEMKDKKFAMGTSWDRTSVDMEKIGPPKERIRRQAPTRPGPSPKPAAKSSP